VRVFFVKLSFVPLTPIAMKKSLVLLSSLALAAPFLLSMTPRADEVTFAPTVGSSVTKTFTITQEFEEGTLTISRAGNDLTIETTGTASQSITIADTYAKMDGAKPVQLVRAFKDGATEIETESALSSKGAEQEFEASGAGDSRLNDLTIVFAWDVDQSEYLKTYDENSEGEDAWLAGINEDMDLRGFLPSGEVAIDDEWEADSSVLLSTFAPGGNLQWDLKMVDEGRNGGVDPAIFSELGSMLEGSDIEGEIKCKYAGPQEVEGAEYLAIEVTILVDALTDLTEDAEADMDGDDLPEGVEIEIGDMAMELHLEGKGLLLWDAQAGHLHSFSYTGDTALNINRVVYISSAGKVIENSTQIDVSGTVSVEVITEP
jgi:hypothetical protein